MQIPLLADVLRARMQIRPYLRPTPLFSYAALNRLVGTEVWVKHENHQPVGAFKVRGGVNLISQLSAGDKQRGVIAASTGNHGQSIAYAAKLFGIRAIICVPERANPVKVEAMQDLGAEIIAHGRDYDDAREYCERLAGDEGYRYIHSGNEPLLIAGVATAALEILQEQPGEVTTSVPPQFQGFAYVLEGDAAFGSNRRRAMPAQLVVLGPGEAFTVRDAAPRTRYLLMAGQPYGEVPVFNGPFVD